MALSVHKNRVAASIRIDWGGATVIQGERTPESCHRDIVYEFRECYPKIQSGNGRVVYATMRLHYPMQPNKFAVEC